MEFGQHTKARLLQRNSAQSSGSKAGRIISKNDAAINPRTRTRDETDIMQKLKAALQRKDDSMVSKFEQLAGFKLDLNFNDESSQMSSSPVLTRSVMGLKSPERCSIDLTLDLSPIEQTRNLKVHHRRLCFPYLNNDSCL